MGRVSSAESSDQPHDWLMGKMPKPGDLYLCTSGYGRQDPGLTTRSSSDVFPHGSLCEYCPLSLSDSPTSVARSLLAHINMSIMSIFLDQSAAAAEPSGTLRARGPLRRLARDWALWNAMIALALDAIGPWLGSTVSCKAHHNSLCLHDGHRCFLSLSRVILIPWN